MYQSDTKAPLRLGFIGGGLSSAVGQVHYSASAMDGCWVLSAGAFSRDQEVNRNTALQWGVEPSRAYDCWRKMIKCEKHNLDAVAVLVPTPMHAEVVQELLAQGVPVICEKSLVNTVEELQLIKSAYEKDKHYLAVTYNYSGYPMVRELKSMIESGELGRIKQFHFEMPQEGFVRPPMIAGKAAPPQSWRLQDSYIPMVSHDLGMHLHHLSSFLLSQEPEQVMAEYSSYSPYHDLIDTVFMWLRYADGMKGSFWFTKSALGNRNGMRIRIYGDKASAEWIQVEPESLKVCRADGTINLIDRGGPVKVASDLRYNRMKAGHPSGFVEAFANLYQDLHSSISAHQQGHVAQDSAFVSDWIHAASGMALFQAASNSNKTGAWEMIRSAV